MLGALQLRLFPDLPQTDFWRWFGRSKVVDERGQPLPVYHGTDGNFDAFRADAARRHGGAYGAGIYFTPRRAYAASFAYGTVPRVLEARVALQRPLVVRTHTTDFPTWFPDSAETPESIRARIERAGYDGVMVYDGQRGVLLEVVAFHPRQIRVVEVSAP